LVFDEGTESADIATNENNENHRVYPSACETQVWSASLNGAMSGETKSRNIWERSRKPGSYNSFEE